MVHEVLSDLEIRIDQTKAQVKIGEMPIFTTDPLQVRQLLQNLIGNDLKFSRPGESPIINVFCEISPDHRIESGTTDRKVCQITVEDNGIGFEKKYIDRIFGVFEGLHGKSEYEGTGIGLSICKKIADRHSGNITAKSAPGEGASFIVSLRLEQIGAVVTNGENRTNCFYIDGG